MNLRHTLTAMSAALAFFASTPTQAQIINASVISEVEGTVTAISTNLNGSVSMTVMGIAVNVPVGTPVNTPTVQLTFAQLVSTTPLPNRTQPGFIGGTAIVTGTSDARGVLTADSVFVEPAENVILGIVTANTATSISVNNVPVVFIQDARMLAEPVKDVNGIEIISSSIPVGTGAALEGYYSNGIFNAFLMEAEEGTPVVAAPQVAITRATARERGPSNQRGDEYEIRGSTTMTHVAPGVTTQTIRVVRIDNGVETLLGPTTATLDVTGIAVWRLRGATATTNNPVLGVAPTLVKAINTSVGANNAFVTSPVNVIQ